MELGDTITVEGSTVTSDSLLAPPRVFNPTYVSERILDRRLGALDKLVDERNQPPPWWRRLLALFGISVLALICVLVLPSAAAKTSLVGVVFILAAALCVIALVLQWPRRTSKPVLVASHTASEPHPLDVEDLESLLANTASTPALSPVVSELVAALEAENVVPADIAAQADEWLDVELARLGVDV